MSAIRRVRVSGPVDSHISQKNKSIESVKAPSGKRNRKNFSKQQRLEARIKILSKLCSSWNEGRDGRKDISALAELACDFFETGAYEAAWRTLVEAEHLFFKEYPDDRLWALAETLEIEAR